MYLYSRIVLTIAAICIASGGLYDVFTPRLPSNLAAKCSGNDAAGIVMRELLRALGACLAAIGATVAIVTTGMDLRHDRRAIAVILMLVLPSEASALRKPDPVALPEVIQVGNGTGNGTDNGAIIHAKGVLAWLGWRRRHYHPRRRRLWLHHPRQRRAITGVGRVYRGE